MMRWLMILVVVVGVLAVIWVLGRQVGTASDLVLHDVRAVSDDAKRRALEIDRLTGASGQPGTDQPATLSAGDGHGESIAVLLPATIPATMPAAAPRSAPSAPAVRRGPPLRVGATMAQVQAVMGDPEVRTWDERGGETWWYGHSSIVLRNRTVASWSEVETPLGTAR